MTIEFVISLLCLMMYLYFVSLHNFTILKNNQTYDLTEDGVGIAIKCGFVKQLF